MPLVGLLLVGVVPVDCRSTVFRCLNIASNDNNDIRLRGFHYVG